MAAALSQSRAQGKPVIPVLLPDAVAPPPFLHQYDEVRIPDPASPGFAATIDRLLQGIASAPTPSPAPPTTEQTLHVRQQGDSYEASRNQTDPFPIQLPLTKPDLDELAWYLERYIDFPGPGDPHATAAGAPPIQLDFCEPPTLPELERRLADANATGRPYRIVHFDGHGQYYPETGVGALCFEDDAGRTRLVPGRDLGDLLSRQRVPLVLLEACRGARLSEQPIFGAVAELPLAGLARPDALHLLHAAIERRAIDIARPGYDRPAMDALLARIDHHPLSIELIAPHLKDLTPTAIADDLAARLPQFQDPSHAEARNRSLLASLDFSRARLSPKARDALAWLGWFQGGMFERFLLAFSQLPEADWAAIRAELVATALLRVEDVGIQIDNTPYLKLHPTLAEAAAGPASAADPRAGRFIDCYLGVGQMIDRALGGTQPAAGMTLTRLELGNLRRALDLAFAAGRHRDGWALGDTLREFLERAGRLRERDRLVEQVRARMPADRPRRRRGRDAEGRAAAVPAGRRPGRRDADLRPDRHRQEGPRPPGPGRGLVPQGPGPGRGPQWWDRG